MRAQTSLPALGFALLLLTGVLVFGVAVADHALVDADRDALDRQAAVDLSDRLLAQDAPLTERANVLNESAVEGLDSTRLQTVYGVTEATDAEISLDGNTIASTGSVEDGSTITRLVVVENTSARTLQPRFVGEHSVTLPRRTDRVRLRIEPHSNTTVQTVRANDRVVLANDSGLRGNFTVALSPYRTTRLRFEATGRLSADSVEVTYYPATTTKQRLEVRVDG